MSYSFAEAVAALAMELPRSYVTAWASVLRRIRAPSDQVITSLIDTRPIAAAQATRLVKAWRALAPELSGESVAFALEAAAHVQSIATARRSSIVVSGPVGDATPVRLTVSVVTEIIRVATKTLLVVSFAAYRVPEITRELSAAAERGVDVHLILESGTDDGGTLTGTTGATTFRSLRGKATFWHWPRSRRPHGGALHAKVIAADHSLALLGSANLTGRALISNIEVGVVLRDPDAIQQLVTHFRTLMRPEVGALEPLRPPSKP
jgi:phosphatidylserine/phosphatidylglycerophosphate/cardiolipin synthase-like enzyme